MKTIFNGVTTPLGPQILSQDATLSALGAGALGKSFVRLGNNPVIDPLVHYYPQTNSDGTVTLLTAAQLAAVAGAGGGGGGDVFLAGANVFTNTNTFGEITHFNSDIVSVGQIQCGNLMAGGGNGGNVLGGRTIVDELHLEDESTITYNSTADRDNWVSQLNAAGLGMANVFTAKNVFNLAVDIKGHLAASSTSAFTGLVTTQSLTVQGTLTATNTINGNISGTAATVATIAGKLVNGTGTTVTGSGTAAAPYMVNVTGGGTGGGDVYTDRINIFTNTNTFLEQVLFNKDIQVQNKSKFNGGLEVVGIGSFTNCNVDIALGSTLHVTGALKLYDTTTFTFTPTAATNLRAAAGASDGIYHGTSPATVAVGGITPGYALTGKSFQQILQDMLVAYLAPSFTSFGIDGYVNGGTVEVGTPFTGVKTFRWGTVNSGNVVSPGIRLSYLPTDLTMASNLLNDGVEPLTASPPWNAPFTPAGKAFRITGTPTQGAPFTRDFSVNAVYPIFYGKSTGERPVIDPSLILAGTPSLVDSVGTVLVPFASLPTSPNDWNWFAIPITGTRKTRWYVDALNNGVIGGEPGNPDGNLFPAEENAYFDSILWEGVEYQVYVTNYRTALANCEMRNF